MRKEYIHSIKYLFQIIKDDYGNDFWLAFVNSKKEYGYSHCSGYYVIAKNGDVSDGFITYTTEAFWKTKERDLLLIEKDGYRIEEYKERMHSMEWEPKSGTAYQAAPEEKLNLVTRFYIRKEII